MYLYLIWKFPLTFKFQNFRNLMSCFYLHVFVDFLLNFIKLFKNIGKFCKLFFVSSINFKCYCLYNNDSKFEWWRYIFWIKEKKIFHRIDIDVLLFSPAFDVFCILNICLDNNDFCICLCDYKLHKCVWDLVDFI